MTPQRILLTGASGFVGRHLAQLLVSRFPLAVVVPTTFDVTDGAAVRDAVRRCRPDACIHLAAISAVAVARSDPDRAWAVNLCGTLRLADALRTEAPDCLLVFASSADAYGASFRSGRPVNEDVPLAPVNVYGATKAAADLALGAMAADGLRVVRMRPFNHTGPGQSEDFVVPAFARQLVRIAKGQQPPVMHVGSLSAVREFMDVRDVCAGYAACIAAADSLVPGTIVNLGTGVPRRIGDVLEDFMQATGIRPEIQASPQLSRPTDIPFACGDSGRASSLLGWTAAIPWPKTVAAVVEDWRGRV